MERLIFETEFRQIGNQEQIRCDPKYRYFYDVNKGVVIERLKPKLLKRRLKSIFKPNKTKTLKKGTLNDEYILIELNDIDSGSGEIKRERIVEEIGSDKTLFGDSDILISKLMPQMGYVVLNDKTKKYIGTTELIGFKIINSSIDKKYLLYLLLSIRENFELLTSGKTHPRIQIQDILRIKIPIPPRDIRKEIVKKIREIEAKIKEEKQKIVPLQDVIDEVSIKYGIKNTKFERKEFEAFTIDASKIARQKFLRCGAQYRAFWDVHNGLLFNEKTKHHIVKLGSVMRLHKTKTLKKGILDKEYILLELEDIESGNGRVTSLERAVTKIGSDKTYFNGCDLITTKLRPYLGYTILNNPEFEMIGTTELLPFKINKNFAYPEYIKYLLLSYEYIEKSCFLMYGKEHPRIHPLDLLNIEVPLPSDLETQQRIVSEIQEQEKINDTAQGKIRSLREEINGIILTTLIEDKKIEV